MIIHAQVIYFEIFRPILNGAVGLAGEHTRSYDHNSIYDWILF